MNDMESMRTATSLIRRATTAGLLVGALSLTAAACGSDSSTSGADSTAAVSTNAPEGEVGISGQWARGGKGRTLPGQGS